MKTEYYFSPGTTLFYPVSLASLYKESGTLPDDLITVDEATFSEFLPEKKEAGKQVGSDSKGNPCWVNASASEDENTDWQAKAESQRQSLLTTANSTTADWRTELQLDAISDDDRTRLINWMAYIKALKALDLSSISDEAGYQAIAWPDKPSD